MMLATCDYFGTRNQIGTEIREEYCANSAHIYYFMFLRNCPGREIDG